MRANPMNQKSVTQTRMTQARMMQMHMTLRTLLGVGAALVLAACTHSGAQRPGVIPPYAADDRISEQAIRADFESMEVLQLRLARLNRDGQVPTSNYHWAKAQCWLDMGRHNYHENDRTGTIEEALKQSETLIKGLENKSALPMDTPLIPQSVKIRDDLWNKAASYKQHAQFSCVAPQVACYEVQLVWMGQEYSEGGWRHANPYIGIAEQMGARIERDLAACAPPPAPVAPRVPVTERMTLAADALFAFDKAGRDDITAEGKAKLEEFAQKAKKIERIDAIMVRGYTDRLGTEGHNLPLSLRRALTVKAYLVNLGLPERAVEAEGKGSLNPVKECSDKDQKDFKALTACLLPNRRVEIELRGAVTR